ncbi:ABC transporter substrate-binding protein, partial [Gardnerella vaginalis]
TKLAKRINNALKDMIKNGSWKRALDDNMRGTGFKPNAKYNPPVPNEGEE